MPNETPPVKEVMGPAMGPSGMPSMMMDKMLAAMPAAERVEFVPTMMERCLTIVFGQLDTAAKQRLARDIVDRMTHVAEQHLPTRRGSPAAPDKTTSSPTRPAKKSGSAAAAGPKRAGKKTTTPKVSSSRTMKRSPAK